MAAEWAWAWGPWGPGADSSEVTEAVPWAEGEDGARARGASSSSTRTWTSDKVDSNNSRVLPCSETEEQHSRPGLDQCGEGWLQEEDGAEERLEVEEAVSAPGR